MKFGTDIDDHNLKSQYYYTLTLIATLYKQVAFYIANSFRRQKH